MRSFWKHIIAAFALTFTIFSAGADGSQLDARVADLAGHDEPARSMARRLLMREDPVEVVARVLPLLSSDQRQVSTAAFNVLADVTSQVGAPGRETRRAAVTRQLMTLVAPDQPEELKDLGLRLLPRAIPPGADVTPVARLLDDPTMRDKALAALEEARTPEACAAIRARLAKAEPAFQCALLNALATLRDAGSVAACEPLLRSGDPRVRAAAIRSIAWTGDPRFVPPIAAILRAADESARAETLDGYLRLIRAVAERGGNWEIAIGAYKELLRGPDPLAKEAALAGLGRYGDGSCVAPILEAIQEAQPRTWAIGIAALDALPGVDTVRAIVTAYPKLPARTQLALIPVLGAKRHPLAATILKEAAESKDAPVRIAGLRALAEAAIPEAADVLSKAAAGPDAEQAAVARDGLLRMARMLAGENKRNEAGQVYVRLFEVARADKGTLAAVTEGLTRCPVPDAFEVCKAVAAEKDSGDAGTKLLMAVAGALNAAKQKDKALELYGLVTQRSPSAEIMQEAARGMAAAGAPVDLQRLLGVITRWWVVGPFDLGDNNEGWANPYIAEPAVSLAGKYMSGKQRVQWTPVTSKDPNGKIDLRATLADRDRCVGYAYTEIQVPAAIDAVLLLGVDDSERIWVNGQKVFEQFVPRGLQVDQDRVPVKLQAGTNRILLKIWQHTLGWEFCARVALPDGRPVAFTQAPAD